MARSVAFIDSEVGVDDKRIKDLGAVRENGAEFHSASMRGFSAFISGVDFLCGHNIVHHDLNYILPAIGSPLKASVIDTLYLSPLLFPKRPYHKLLKDDKLQSDELNNPLNDAKKARDLFFDELSTFEALPYDRKTVYYMLLKDFKEFKGFFEYAGFRPFYANLPKTIAREFRGNVCENADIDSLIKQYPVELAYALALIGSGDYHSVTPPWLAHNYPAIDNVLHILCNTPCKQGCRYCRSKLDIHRKLKEFFGYDEFRTYDGEPLQEMAAQAAADGKSLLAVFPTGGGKSITFQLPALMAGQAEHGLTVVISPLQSLMKDQVDSLNEKGLVDAVTVNGLLSPVERAEALERVSSGLATMLYISPEQLRSSTIEKLLISRNVVRFVIDEAHCFSAWGQDFRVDYLYIGDFIRELKKKKDLDAPIPVSCFTATAKQKVISDIRDYFKRKLDLDLELYATSASRENLRYAVLFKETDEEKYNTLRSLIESKKCPTIVYVSRTRRTRELAEKLTRDGFPARPYNGKMEPGEKIENQDAFIRNEVGIIVATSAFGMGVDKKDVGLVVHYDISDSLENYVQEAGRAGRDPLIRADCYVLYNDGDLNKHFLLLNQTKLSISEIQQVWKAVKDMTKLRPTVCCSPLEIARQAGWDDSGGDIETRVKTAVAALENAGYLRRGKNVPRVYATSILASNMTEAANLIDASMNIPDELKQNAKRIIKSLISSRSIAGAGNAEAESRVDYLADTLGIEKKDVIECINLMRRDGLLSDSMDMSAYILKSDTQNRSSQILERFAKLEKYLLTESELFSGRYSLKEINDSAQNAGIAAANVKNIKTVIYYLTIKGCISQQEGGAVTPLLEEKNMLDKFYTRIDICRFIVAKLYEKASESPEDSSRSELPVQFSLVGLFKEYIAEPRIIPAKFVALKDVEDALLYLSKIGAMRLEGGFLVLYNALEIKRLNLDNRSRYKVDDYSLLNEFYKQKIRQIHIVGEYANLMVRDYNAALKFVSDYFNLDFKLFISRYFKGERIAQIDRNITPDKYNELFGNLSDVQSEIINDSVSKYIVVAAGPGSGKTRVLVHKLASLLLLEDVKHEQLLMVTFSRAAATEFKKRLIELIGNAAQFVEIKTFHSYCFDLLGRIGSLEGVDDVVKNAAEMIKNGEVEPGKIAKTVLVIDEAQDMDEHEFDLICALMKYNEDMRVIAVGDDDQNIYEFRGSDSKYMQKMIDSFGATKYEMTENFRSGRNIVALANEFAHSIGGRMKQNDIVSVNGEAGEVKIFRHISENLEQPIVDHIEKHRGKGTVCVLTNTNDEALTTACLLNRRGIRAKLIQSTDSFRLYDLAEVRYFLKCINRNSDSPSISDEALGGAKERLISKYSGSTCLEVCLNMISSFEKINPGTKYRTDLEEFIRESQYEDFYSDDSEAVYVSTVHKSKGREFDSVYMLLDDRFSPKDDADRRRLYVGMTRAKKRLYIHCNSGIFDKYNIPGVEKIEDRSEYPPPEELILSLTHRDVVLDFFKGKKELIFGIISGTKLGLSNGFLTAKLNGREFRVVKLSKACCENLAGFEKKGYSAVSAEARFTVAWKGKEDSEETAVLLADIRLKRQ